MIRYNRSFYASASQWLEAIKQDRAWLSQLQQLQNATPAELKKQHQMASNKIEKSDACDYWHFYNKQVDRVKLVVEELWEAGKMTPAIQRTLIIWMLTEEWLEQHSEIDIQASEKPKRPSSKQKPKAKADRKPSDKPLTLKYYMHGNNGVLMRQRKRVHQVFKMWNRWGWIDEQTSLEDFDTFFEGEPRHCNITWKANGTILTILLQELLEQLYIEKPTGCAAKSLVKQQFGKTANSDRTRLDNISEKRIKLTLLVLDPQNHNLIFQDSDDLSEIQDIQDAALKEIFAGKLRSTKGI